MKKGNIELTQEDAENTPAGGVVVGKRDGQTMIYDDASLGGYFVGKLHKDGGIKMVNKSTGQPLEVQGSEVIITAPAVSDQTKREFEGKMMTNREILSKINSDGGGVSFADGGDIPAKIHTTDKEYEYGGKMVHDSEIAHSLGMNSTLKKGKQHFSSGDTTYDVDAIYNAIKKGKLRLKTKEVETFAMKYPVYDKKYSETVKTDFRKPNGIMVRLENGEEVLIDGNHRMNNAYLKGKKTIKTYYIEDPKQIAKFTKKNKFELGGENKVGGHLSKNKSLKQIAEMHNVSLAHINEELAKGLEVEKEHFADFKERTRVAKDHLVENPNYYSILEKAGLERGGEIEFKNVDDLILNKIWRKNNLLKFKTKDNKYFYIISSNSNNGFGVNVYDAKILDKSIDEGNNTIPEKSLIAKAYFDLNYNNNTFSGYSSNQSIEVNEKYRRIGIATAITDFVEHITKMKYVPSKLLSEEMQGFVKNRFSYKHGGTVRRGSLVRDAKSGNTPARDLNNYNDIMDLEADGMVGMESGLAFANGGEISELKIGDIFKIDSNSKYGGLSLYVPKDDTTYSFDNGTELKLVKLDSGGDENYKLFSLEQRGEKVIVSIGNTSLKQLIEDRKSLKKMSFAKGGGIDSNNSNYVDPAIVEKLKDIGFDIYREQTSVPILFFGKPTYYPLETPDGKKTKMVILGSQRTLDGFKQEIFIVNWRGSDWYVITFSDLYRKKCFTRVIEGKIINGQSQYFEFKPNTPAITLIEEKVTKQYQRKIVFHQTLEAIRLLKEIILKDLPIPNLEEPQAQGQTIKDDKITSKEKKKIEDVDDLSELLEMVKSGNYANGGKLENEPKEGDLITNFGKHGVSIFDVDTNYVYWLDQYASKQFCKKSDLSLNNLDDDGDDDGYYEEERNSWICNKSYAYANGGLTPIDANLEGDSVDIVEDEFAKGGVVYDTTKPTVDKITIRETKYDGGSNLYSGLRENIVGKEATNISYFINLIKDYVGQNPIEETDWISFYVNDGKRGNYYIDLNKDKKNTVKNVNPKTGGGNDIKRVIDAITYLVKNYDWTEFFGGQRTKKDNSVIRISVSYDSKNISNSSNLKLTNNTLELYDFLRGLHIGDYENVKLQPIGNALGVDPIEVNLSTFSWDNLLMMSPQETAVKEINRILYGLFPNLNFDKFVKSEPNSNASKELDLTDTKVWIGDDPKLSEEIQKAVFSLGWTWSGRKEVKFTDAKYLIFNSGKFIGYRASGTRNDFDSNTSKELNPQDILLAKKPTITTSQTQYPEYYEFIENFFSNSFTKGKIYKIKNPKDLHASNNFVNDSGLPDGYGTLNDKYFKPSTEEAFLAQQSGASASAKSFDFTDTKINVSSNPDLSRKVQKQAFENGWEWENNGGKTIDYNDFSYLYFTKTSISYGNTNISFVNSPKREITEEEIFGGQKNASKITDLEVTSINLSFEVNGNPTYYSGLRTGKDFIEAINNIEQYNKNIDVPVKVDVSYKVVNKFGGSTTENKYQTITFGKGAFVPSNWTVSEIKSILSDDWFLNVLNFDKIFSDIVSVRSSTAQPFDLSKTKIVLDDPEMSEKVQKRAFELGWSWNGSKEVKNTNERYMFFDKEKNISSGSSFSGFQSYQFKEIFEHDLFGSQGSNLEPYEASQVTLNWENELGRNQKATFYNDGIVGNGQVFISYLKEIEKNSNGKDVEVSITAYAQDNDGKEIQRDAEFKIGENWFKPSTRTNEQIKSIVENEWIDGINFDKFFQEAQTPTSNSVVPKTANDEKFTDFKEVVGKLEGFASKASEKYNTKKYEESLELLNEVKDDYALALSFTPESSFMYERIELMKKIAEVQKEITRITELKSGGAYYILSKVIERLEKGEDWKESGRGEIVTNEVPQQEIDSVIHTEKFKNWFGNWEKALITKEYDYVSKAITEIGKPCVMYHGAKRIKFSYRQVSNGVLYLAENRSYAEWFSANESPYQKQGDYLTQCFVNIKNPIDLTPLGVEELDLRDIIQFIDSSYPLAKIYDVLQPNTAMQIMNNNLIGGQLFRAWNIIRQYPKLNEHIRDNTSYDGFIYYENNPSDKIISEITGELQDNVTKATAVFNSNQVKLVDAMLFDSSLDDWRFETGGKVN